MLMRGDCDQEEYEGWGGRGIRCGNAGKPLLRIAGDPILDDLLVMEADADGKSGKKGERGEGGVGDSNPTGRERDGG